jgi:hypothetical protein
MQQYRTWKPTEFDLAGLSLPDRQNWFVLPVMQTRDSGNLALSNFAVTLDVLGGESNTVEIHRFSHWGPGWIEIILLHPSREDEGKALETTLEEYPILDDDHYSALEHTRASEYWDSISLEERVYWCQRYDVSIFAARRDTVPDDENGELITALAA